MAAEHGQGSRAADHGGHDHEDHVDRGSQEHGHQHEGGGHSHGVSADADARYLTVALSLLVGFIIVEVVAAVLSGSLALLSDAGHMLTDVAALAASLWLYGWRPAPPPGCGRSASNAPRSFPRPETALPFLWFPR